MNKHEHGYSGCNHELKYCSHCDVVYCIKCGKEWGYYYFNPYYPYIVTYKYTDGANQTVGGTFTLDPNTVQITPTHKHE